MKKCAECAYAVPGDIARCGLMNGAEVSKACSYHTTNPKTCMVCGGIMLPWVKMILMEQDGKWIEMCPGCDEKLYKCATCVQRDRCAFEEASEPNKMVMVQMQQGNMTYSGPARNPELVKKYCHSCCCWSEDERRCGKSDDRVGCPRYSLMC